MNVKSYLFALTTALAPPTVVAESATDRFVENMTAVLSAKSICGYSIDETTFGISMMAMGLTTSDIAPGGRYRSDFDNWVYRIQNLTSTEEKRRSYCKSVGTNLSAFFTSTPGLYSSPTVRKREIDRPAVTTKNQKKTSPVETVKPDSEIQKIQTKLRKLGFSAGRADGYMGPHTRSAIVDFQSQYDMERTGNISNALKRTIDNVLATIEKTNSIASSANINNKTSFKKIERSRKNEIERTQFYLGVLELYDGPKDGVMNGKLEEAILRFQVSHRLSANGKVSPELVATIKSILFR